MIVSNEFKIVIFGVFVCFFCKVCRFRFGTLKSVLQVWVYCGFSFTWSINQNGLIFLFNQALRLRRNEFTVGDLLFHLIYNFLLRLSLFRFFLFFPRVIINSLLLQMTLLDYLLVAEIGLHDSNNGPNAIFILFNQFIRMFLK